MSSNGPVRESSAASDQGGGLLAERHTGRAWSSLFLAGVLLLVVGVGNWVVGTRKVRQYREELDRLPRPVSRQVVSPLPRLPTDDEENYRIVRSKMDFYHVVASGGRLIAVAGLILGAAGALWPPRSGRGLEKENVS